MTTVLLVEDNTNQRALYTQELQDEGYQVVAVGSGREALKLVRSASPAPDVVVLDICMPGMDGVETLEALLAADRRLPVVLNTAYTSYRDNFLTWSAMAYVVKSADLTELKDAIKQAVAERDK